MARDKLTKEQQESLNEFARLTYLAATAGDGKKAEVKKEAFQKCVLDFAAQLDEGVPVSFKTDKGVVKGVLKTKYSKGWEFIRA